MKINIDHLINCYEEMIKDVPIEATTCEIGAITAELVLEGLKQQRDYIKHLMERSKTNISKLATLLDHFYWEGSGGHVMYFTEGESEILAKYLIDNGVRIIEKNGWKEIR